MSQATLTIDLNAVTKNYQLLDEKSGNAECAAVVKANGYGLGMKQVATALTKAGCSFFFVATVDEALELRAILKEPKIAIFHGVLSKIEAELCLEHQLMPVLNDFYQIEIWQEVAKDSEQLNQAILHIDTGMNRLGFASNTDFTAMLNDVAFVMSHMSCAEQADHPMNQTQLQTFKEVIQHFPDSKYSLANSSGIFLKDAHFDLVRPGMALYGLNPTPDADSPMHNVVTLSAPILQVRVVPAETAIGYGGYYTTARPSKIATVSAGYADGYLRSLSNLGKVQIGDTPAPVVGRISMDLITIDVTDLPDHEIQPGTMVELLGNHCTVDDIAEKAGTIGYEILTSLGDRYERLWV